MSRVAWFSRATRWAAFAGSSRFQTALMTSTSGNGATKLGLRCSMVTVAPSFSRAGTRVTAVAPDPMTTMRAPLQSRSSGHCCGWMICPVKSSSPGKCGRWPRSWA